MGEVPVPSLLNGESFLVSWLLGSARKSGGFDHHQPQPLSLLDTQPYWKEDTNTRRLFPLKIPSHFASFLDVTFGDCSFRARLASINEETAVDTPCLVQDGWRLGSLDGQFGFFFPAWNWRTRCFWVGRHLTISMPSPKGRLFSCLVAGRWLSVLPPEIIWPDGWFPGRWFSHVAKWFFYKNWKCTHLLDWENLEWIAFYFQRPTIWELVRCGIILD